MAEENKAPNQNGEGADNSKDTTPVTDAFGQPTDPETKPAEGEGEGEGVNGEGENGKKKEEDKNAVAIPDDHPTIVALKKQIDDVKAEYGGNLSGQRDVIKRLETEIETLKKGGKPDGAGEGESGEDVLFKDIKWSKDLSKEEKEEMTDTEIKQMDEIARMQEAQNKMYAEMQNKGKTEETKKAEDVQSLVKDTAKELAKEESDGKDNIELANQIIESVKQFNLEGLSEAEVKERVARARKLLPDYEPPKEQTKKNGKTVDTTKVNDDPFGVDKIIEEATSGDDGNYKL